MAKFTQEFINIDLKKLHDEATSRCKNGWRYVQTLAVKVDGGTDLIYSFMKDGKLENLKVQAVTEKDTVQSITDCYIEAFVWENEIHDLWNINFKDIAIDFKGTFYKVATDAPMTIISPEVLERREKQAKIEAAMAAKKAKDAADKKDDKPAEKKDEGKGE